MTENTRHETPDVAELRRLAEAATPGPWEAFGAVDGRRGERWLGVTTDMRAIESARAGDVFAAQNCTRQDALFIAAANPAVMLALLDAAAERDRLAECVRAYGRTIDRWGLLIIAATHSEDITTPDGDGDWEVIESRLAEVPALLAERDALAAKLGAVREWIDRRGVNVGDRDDDYMRGYRDAQRHAILDAAELRWILDAETGSES